MVRKYKSCEAAVKREAFTWEAFTCGAKVQEQRSGSEAGRVYVWCESTRAVKRQ